ncbi:hypothetical protein SAMN05216565_105233 [Litchfieldia salsa]|uniref:Uncharacterized protein n=1 Tax=Litchfieldia salsa TaxID=930152 RepID=A0A1H0UYE8_9BACI|nr:hypothetical protein SAMN05216565_105233 [Litchfieldia salsa]
MFEAVDWKLVTFVSYTLFHEYIVHIRFPQIYYMEQMKQQELDTLLKKD